MWRSWPICCAAWCGGGVAGWLGLGRRRMLSPQGIEPQRRHRRLRHRAQDAREFSGARAAAGAHRAREGFAARRLRHRRAAGRSASQGVGGAGRAHRSRGRLCDRQREWRVERNAHRISVRLRGRDGKHADGRDARRWRNGPEERRARTGDRRSRPLPDRDGREDFRARHVARSSSKASRHCTRRSMR